MAYHSPLGYNFKLEASISAAKELQAKESCKKNEFVSNDLGMNRASQFERRNSGSKYSDSPGWQRESWKSPDPRHSLHKEPVNISNYYHPSMLENPWEELEDGKPS